ncbi:probable polygalacturonase At3g15720 [Cajanus cajan]|uniref:probable polygalacturonase At3g15720 n=1 Tax=Cajanus cajan TaxID=3821 RepID=UPI00098DBB78|nr:probable polygalacturonase At3g15720 [Cajanus cajan]
MKDGTATLEVPHGKTFKLKPLQFNGPCNFPSVHFQLEGNIIAPRNTKAWKGHDSERWIEFLNIDGLIIDGGGQINARGSVWWEFCRENSCSRPTALFIHNCNKFLLNGTRHLNSARNHISINSCTNSKVYNVTTIAPEDSPNTDGIDISQSSYILIQDSTFATGDDCIAINGGTSYINITGVTCGPGHGISVGSLGKKQSYEVVEHVRVYNCSFTGTTNGMRIKTWEGGSGYARNISFQHIILTNTSNPIIIDQKYSDLTNEGKEQTSAVQISGVTYRDVKGTSQSEIAIILDCGGVTGCTDIFMDSINITATSSGSKVRASCNNVHGFTTFTSPPVPCLS